MEIFENKFEILIGQEQNSSLHHTLNKQLFQRTGILREGVFPLGRKVLHVPLLEQSI